MIICKRDEKSFVIQKGVQKIFFENKKGNDVGPGGTRLKTNVFFELFGKPAWARACPGP